MTRENYQSRGAAERHLRYAALRAEGYDPWEAVRELGLEPQNAAKRYERWLKAQQAGEHFLKGTPRMGKQAPPPPLEDRAAEALQELRELVREAHGVLRDLRAANAAAQRFLSVEQRFLQSELHTMVENAVLGHIQEGMAAYGASTAKAIEDARDRVFQRFDKLVASLFGGEQIGERTFEELVTQFAQRQQLLEARLVDAGRLEPGQLILPLDESPPPPRPKRRREPAPPQLEVKIKK